MTLANRTRLPWLPIDDAVMGGVSHSEMRIENGRAVFAGVVSLDFGGGFASVRSNPGAWDLSAFTGIEALLRGDGRRYKLILKSDAGLDGVNWQAPFQTRRDEHQMVRIPFQDLVPVYRGSRVSNISALRCPLYRNLRISHFRQAGGSLPPGDRAHPRIPLKEPSP